MKFKIQYDKFKKLGVIVAKRKTWGYRKSYWWVFVYWRVWIRMAGKVWRKFIQLLIYLLLFFEADSPLLILTFNHLYPNHCTDPSLSLSIIFYSKINPKPLLPSPWTGPCPLLPYQSYFLVPQLILHQTYHLLTYSI